MPLTPILRAPNTCPPCPKPLSSCPRLRPRKPVPPVPLTFLHPTPLNPQTEEAFGTEMIRRVDEAEGRTTAIRTELAAQVGAVGTNQTFMPGVLNGTNGLVYYNPNNLTNYWILTP